MINDNINDKCQAHKNYDTSCKYTNLFLSEIIRNH